MIGERERCVRKSRENEVKELLITVSRKLELESYFVRDILDELVKKGYISIEERRKYR